MNEWMKKTVIIIYSSILHSFKIKTQTICWMKIKNNTTKLEEKS